MGDAKAGPVRLSYNPQLRVELHGATVNDAERLAEDPTFRMLASRERREASVALTSDALGFWHVTSSVQKLEERELGSKSQIPV